MVPEKLQILKPEPSAPTDKKAQRGHKPEEYGSRVFQKKVNGPYHIDMRWQGKGRPVLRNPDAAGWPNAGATTTMKSEALKWAKRYDAVWAEDQERADQRRHGVYRSLRLGKEAFLLHRSAQHGTDSSTVSGDSTAIGHLLDCIEDSMAPSDVTTCELQAICDEFLAEGYKVRSVTNIRNHWIQFFKFMKIIPNPALEVVLPKDAKSDIVPWTEAELKRIRKAADELDAELGWGPRLRLLVELMLATGVRIQEAAAAKWEDFDEDAGTVRVYEQIGRKTNLPRVTKGKKPRTAAVHIEWWDFFDRAKTGLITPDENGLPIPYRRLYGLIRDVLERAGLKKSGEAAHQFRHTYSFHFLKRRGGIDNLQKCLGHKRISTTQMYYDHWTSKHAAVEAVRQMYGGERKTRRGPRK